MELRHIRYFVMAAEEKSISSAAARLNISQPAVSRQIRDLESELDVPLFERTPGGLILTDAGQVALQHAGGIVELANDDVIVCAGGILPNEFLKRIGIRVETKYGTA